MIKQRKIEEVKTEIYQNNTFNVLERIIMNSDDEFKYSKWEIIVYNVTASDALELLNNERNQNGN